MFKSVNVLLMAVLASAVAFTGIANADGIVTLGKVQVTATTSDHVVVYIPADYLEAARFKRAAASISDTDYVTDLSRVQVCQVLKQHPPQNCTMSNYPASPGIRSAAGAAWAGNGCGASPMSTAFASVILQRISAGLYSGDLNKPVKRNPAIDFTAICNNHDRGYTSIATKATTDTIFANQLSALCNASPGDVGTCLAFKNAYVLAVKTLGGSAYDQDQKQLACSAWGDSMKKSGCV